jgi:uncharacterized protein YggU (UPF0235/DUF167 family)
MLMLHHLLVKPNSRQGPLVTQTTDGLVVYLRVKAIGGAANKELLETLAKYFAVPKTHVVIKRGAASRHKTVEVV